MSEGNNRRLLDRCTVSARIEVINQLTGKKIGDLVNIHTEGLMLANSGGIEAGGVYQVSLQPIGAAESVGQFELGIETLWVRDMAQDEGCWVGCRIISGTEESLEKIQQIINFFQ